MNGIYVNTAFVLFDPTGEEHLSRTGRSPAQVLGRWRSNSTDSIIRHLESTTLRYQQKGKPNDAVLQDFLSFRQALNVASADQRLLVFVNADESAIKKLTPSLKELFADEDVIGRFHLDLAGQADATWVDAVKGSESAPAINIIRAGKFGMDGAIMSRLPLDVPLESLKAKLLADNKEFGLTEERKVYASHVMEGKRKGIEFELEIPYGEDRDGDGEIDRSRSRGGSSGRGRRRGTNRK